MIRLLRFILQIAILAALAFWLADRPGTAQIVWRDTVIETSAAFLALCVLLFAYGLHLVFRVWHFLRHGPALWRMQRKVHKLQDGQNQLIKGLVAIASGDAATAGRLAVAARKNIGNEIASQWLQAQAAQLAGDRRAAMEIFRTLASNDEAAVLGYRGLITEAKRDGDWDEVDRLLGELHRVKPALPWGNLVRMESAARRRQWEEAEKALAHPATSRLIDSVAGRRARAALRLAVSRNAAISENKTAALQAAEQAVKHAPHWPPAIINLAEILAGTGHRRAALRIAERAWKTQPHPQLAQVVFRMAENPLDGFKEIERLCRNNETAPESRLALADAALAASVWGEARRNLMACVNDRSATQGVYKMLARLERFEKSDERAATAWLMKAAEAPPDPTWLCAVCGASHENWHPLCASCGSFDSLEWQSAGRSRGAIPFKRGLLNDD